MAGPPGVTNGYCKQAPIAARTLRALALDGFRLASGGAMTIELVSVWHHDPGEPRRARGHFSEERLGRQPRVLVVASLDHVARMTPEVMNVVGTITETQGFLALSLELQTTRNAC